MRHHDIVRCRKCWTNPIQALQGLPVRLPIIVTLVQNPYKQVVILLCTNGYSYLWRLRNVTREL